MTYDDLFEDLLGDEMYNIVGKTMNSAPKNRRFGIHKWGHLVHRVPTKQTNRPNSQYRGAIHLFIHTAEADRNLNFRKLLSCYSH